MRVLVAEDDMETRDALVTMLEKAGVEVIAVGTAAEAMAEFERSAPELIVSDIGLPEEDGFQLMQRIRSLELERNLPATPAIALTAFAGPQPRTAATPESRATTSTSPSPSPQAR